MPSVDVNYEIREMIEPPELPFEPDVGVELDFRRAFGIPLEDRVAIVIPAQGVLGGEKESRILQDKMTAGAVIDCEQKVWTIESEPTGDNTFGFIVYTDERKAVIAGSGTVPGDTEHMEFSFASVYDGVTTSPKAMEVKAYCRNTPIECGVSVKWSY